MRVSTKSAKSLASAKIAIYGTHTVNLASDLVEAREDADRLAKAILDWHGPTKDYDAAAQGLYAAIKKHRALNRSASRKPRKTKVD